MNDARDFASVALWNGYFYIAGGYDNRGGLISSVEFYEVRTNKWTKVAPMKHARSSFALIDKSKYMYAIGAHHTIEKFDPYRNSWTEVCKRKLNIQR